MGTVITMPFFTLAQRQALFNDAKPPRPLGQTVAFHVVGIEQAEAEFPIGTRPHLRLLRTTDRPDSRPSRYQYLVRLRSAAELPRFEADLDAMHPAFVQNQDTIATAVATSIHPQAVGWWVLAILAGLAGLAVIGQALGRQSVVESEEYPTFAALGVERRHLVVLGTARNAVVAVPGRSAPSRSPSPSPLSPPSARPVWPSPPPASPSTLSSSSWARRSSWSWCWSSASGPRCAPRGVRIGDDRVRTTRPSAIVARVAGAGAPPSAVIGVRHALERGRGAATVPVGTALFGTVLAVTALSAHGRLRRQPVAPDGHARAVRRRLSAADLERGGSGNIPAQVAQPRARPGDHRHHARNEERSLDQRDERLRRGGEARPGASAAVEGLGATSWLAIGEIALGSTTLHKVGARLGSTVDVKVQLPHGGTRDGTVPCGRHGVVPRPVRPGGTGLRGGLHPRRLPPRGCVPPVRPRARARAAYQANQTFAVLAGAVPGEKGQAAVAHFVRVYQGENAERPTVPTSLVNFGEAVNFPLILGFVLALFGAATLLHLLVVSVARRRREIGLLKALGLVNGQVGAAVCWQATTVALVGIVVGVPVGRCPGPGRVEGLRHQLGAVPVATVPAWLIAALAVGVLVVANLLAVVPAIVAARSKTAGQLLRTQ